MVKLLDEFVTDKKNMNASYCDALMDAAAADGRVVILDCDVSHSVGTMPFFDRFPERAFNCGIQEANACSMAGGMSAEGFVPFVHSFAVFTSRRMLDQIFISCAYSKQNVKLVGGDVGVCVAGNGGTHMAFEDVAALRAIPGITLVDISDPVLVQKLLPQIAAHYGVDYIRMPRKSIVKIYDESSVFTLGKGALITDGCDVTLIASSVTVIEAIYAARELEKEGVSVRLIDMHTIKPLDEELVIESAKKTGAIVTAENHNVIGGLGSAVAEVLSERCPTPMERIGVREQFGQVGTQKELTERYGLSAKHIYDAAKRVISRKG